MDFLLQPYPFEDGRYRLKLSTLIALFVYGVLAIMQPFDLNRLEPETRQLLILGYGILVWVDLLLFHVLMPKILPRVFEQDNWKVYQEMIWLAAILVIIGTSIAAYEDIIATRPLCLRCWTESVFKTVIIGIIPVTMMVMTNRFRLLRKHLREAQQLSGEMGSSGRSENAQGINIVSNNKGEDLHLRMSDLLFVSSLGNYVEVHHTKDGKPTKTVLRISLNSVDEQLRDHPQIFRSHRSFLVNVDNVVSVDGNAGGYDLSFGSEGAIASVAKRKTAEFRTMMSGK